MVNTERTKNLIIVAEKIEALASLHDGLVIKGFNCSVIPYNREIIEQIFSQPPDAVLVEVNGYMPAADIRRFIARLKEVSSLPVIALLAKGMLDGIDGSTDVDDFLTSPYDTGELILRIKRLFYKAEVIEEAETIKCDGLKIDLARCEVTVEGGRIELTFKEYELLKFLAGNPGRVHTREALLDKVWGMDYYGGDRTVDVHIRRLRNKIESPKHEFIETVRNIGYRFRRNV